MELQPNTRNQYVSDLIEALEDDNWEKVEPLIEKTKGRLKTFNLLDRAVRLLLILFHRDFIISFHFNVIEYLKK